MDYVSIYTQALIGKSRRVERYIEKERGPPPIKWKYTIDEYVQNKYYSICECFYRRRKTKKKPGKERGGGG